MLRMSAMEFWLLLLAFVFIGCGIDFIFNPQDTVVFHHSSRFVHSTREFIKKDSVPFYGVICVLLGGGLIGAIAYGRRTEKIKGLRVDTRPEIPEEDFTDVIHTTNSSDFLTVKLALDTEKIPHNFSGDILIGQGDDRLARFFVPTEYKEKARQVLNKLQLDQPRR